MKALYSHFILVGNYLQCILATTKMGREHGVNDCELSHMIYVVTWTLVPRDEYFREPFYFGLQKTTIKWSIFVGCVQSVRRN